MRLLVVDLLGGLGDLIMVLPAVHALAEAHPGAELTVLTHAPGAVLLARDPAVTRVRVADQHDERRAVEAALRAHEPDLAVTTTRFDGIGELIDDDAAARGTRAVTNLWRRPPPDELVGQRYLRILAAEGVIAGGVRAPWVVLGDDERAAGRADMAPFGARPTVLHTDAGMAVKRWPADRWAELAARVPNPVSVGPVSMGPVSVGMVAGVRELDVVDLRRLAARFAAVGEAGGVVVGGDTGPVRLAAAVGTRVVTLFGPTLASRYGIESATNLQGLPGCPHRRPTAITEQVCWWDGYCPLSGTGPACLEDVPVERVADAVAG